MTILSLAMLARLMAPGGSCGPSDLEPAKVWAGLERPRLSRAWGRTVKFYDNLKVVYQIQTTLREWQQQDEEQQSAPAQETRTGQRRAEAAGDVRSGGRALRPVRGSRRSNRPGGITLRGYHELPESSGRSGNRILPYLRQAGMRRVPPRSIRHGVLRGACARAGSGRRAAAGQRPRRPSTLAPRPAAWLCSTPISLPALAYFWAWIPGVGAIYNGQYAKGLMHAVMLGHADEHRQFARGRGMEPIFVILVMAWWPTWSSRPTARAQRRRRASRWTNTRACSTCAAPAGPGSGGGGGADRAGRAVAAAHPRPAGFRDVVRYWPVLLIAAGAYLLWRASPARTRQGDAP